MIITHLHWVLERWGNRRTLAEVRDLRDRARQFTAILGCSVYQDVGLYFHMSRSALDSVVSCTRLFSADGATVPPFCRFFPSCSVALWLARSRFYTTSLLVYHWAAVNFHWMSRSSWALGYLCSSVSFFLLHLSQLPIPFASWLIVLLDNTMTQLAGGSLSESDQGTSGYRMGA